ncbi:hypothetical protein KRZ98_05765 [Sphingobium sp. AS12]|nr:hypothetical protein [Sphingobium sp. AS12]MBV2147795.1 hypothetical protein [Sphingobium sp. AS12]
MRWLPLDGRRWTHDVVGGRRLTVRRPIMLPGVLRGQIVERRVRGAVLAL